MRMDREKDGQTEFHEDGQREGRTDREKEGRTEFHEDGQRE